jgi:hypothetical protein
MKTAVDKNVGQWALFEMACNQNPSPAPVEEKEGRNERGEYIRPTGILKV